jgi:hypothetical protein
MATEKILSFENEIEAHLMDEILTDRNIPHMLRSYHDSAYDGLWQTRSVWGHLEAPAEHRDEILRIYDEIRTQGNNPVPDK